MQLDLMMIQILVVYVCYIISRMKMSFCSTGKQNMGFQLILLNATFVQRSSGQVDHLIYIKQKSIAKLVNCVENLFIGLVIE